MGAALWSWFLVGSEGNVTHWSLLAGCRFRISVPRCFAVWGSMFLEVVPSFSFRVAKGAFWRLAAPAPAAPPAAAAGAAAAAGPKAQQLNSLCFYQNPEGTSSLGAACFWRSFRPSVAWCFGVAKGVFWRLAAPAPAAPLAAAAGAAAAAAAAGPAAAIALFLTESRRDVKPPGSMFFGGRSVLL